MLRRAVERGHATATAGQREAPPEAIRRHGRTDGEDGARNGNLQGQLKLVEKSYGQDVLLLVLARGYLGKLLDNKAVYRFLKQRYPDILVEFEKIVQTVALDGQ